ncbi:restriction endonuclease subunit S [Candidatus Saccharibacteria bacterium]|nr:restriction endonuclease subunit S [Candidatus Saccharibacteria bacterium]
MMTEYKIKEILRFHNGRGYNSISEQGLIPVYGSGGVMGYTDESLLEGEYILLPRKGSLNNYFYINKPFWNVDTIYATNVVKDGVDCKYLYYYFKCLNLGNLDSGSTLPSMTQSAYGSIKVKLPSHDTQKTVAKFLTTIDDKISVNNKIIETSEKLMREIYDYWFVQFDFPDENGRPYKSSGGEMVYDETLRREIPKGWSVKRVDELCEVKTGKEDANFSVPDGDYKFFTCADEPLRCNTPCFSGKSILIAGNGNFNVKHYDGNFNAYQRTYVLQPGDEFYGITFIEAKNKTELFTKGSNGSIVKFITKGDVGSIYVLTSLRAMELYETFNTILAEIDAVQSENEKLASLRDWLLPMLMNGQVTIKE